MPVISVSDETYRRLAERAAAERTTVEKLATPVLERLAEESAANAHAASAPELPSAEDWVRKVAALDALILARGERYPVGFQADVSREAIYEGCGE